MMKYLADTHILLWAMENNIENTKMPTKAKEIMLDENSMIFQFCKCLGSCFASC